MHQLKTLFTVVMVGALSACSTSPDRDRTNGSTNDQIVHEDTAPGVSENKQQRVEVLPLDERQNDSLSAAGLEQEQSLDEVSRVDEDIPHEPVIYFSLDQYELNDANTRIVGYFSRAMLDHPKQKVSVQGHTDERGSPEYNLALGEKRAKSVAQAMMLFGVPESSIEITSFGEEEPADTASTESAWQKNRRVEMVIQ